MYHKSPMRIDEHTTERFLATVSLSPSSYWKLQFIKRRRKISTKKFLSEYLEKKISEDVPGEQKFYSCADLIKILRGYGLVVNEKNSLQILKEKMIPAKYWNHPYWINREDADRFIEKQCRHDFQKFREKFHISKRKRKEKY